MESGRFRGLEFKSVWSEIGVRTRDWKHVTASILYINRKLLYIYHDYKRDRYMAFLPFQFHYITLRGQRFKCWQNIQVQNQSIIKL